jgi:hypothetical protein
VLGPDIFDPRKTEIIKYETHKPPEEPIADNSEEGGEK